jgi:type IV pilus assembly protein PilN
MARINLLPWREARRNERKRRFGIAAFLAAVLSGLVVAGVHMTFENMIANQAARNAYLKNQLKFIDALIDRRRKLDEKKKEILSRFSIIQELQQNRYLAVAILDGLAMLTPKGMTLTRLRQSGRELLIEGHAESNALVSEFMRNLNSFQYFDSPRLTKLKSHETEDKKGRVSVFSLEIELTMGAGGTGKEKENKRKERKR